MRTAVVSFGVVLLLFTLAASAPAADLLNQVGVAHAGSGNVYLVARQREEGGVECRLVDAAGTPAGSPVVLSNVYSCNPDIAWDATLGRFLVVWSESESGGSSYAVKARFVTSAGDPSGEEMIVESGLTQQPGPRVVWGSHTGRYLVVFTNHASLRARVVNGDGSFDGAAFDVIPGSSHPGLQFAEATALEYDGVNHRFLVAGILFGYTSPPMSLYGAVLNDAAPVTVATAPFPIHVSDTYLYPPALAFDPDHERFLAVWEVYTGSGHELWGQMLEADGSLRGDNWKIEDNRTVSFANDVAYRPGDGSYLVAWLDERDPYLSIRGQEVDADGSNVGDDFLLVSRGYQYDLNLTVNPVSDNTLLAYGSAGFEGYVVTPPPPMADLSVALEAPAQVLRGRDLTLGITVKHESGDAASGVVVTFVLPAAVSFVSGVASQGTCEESGGTVTGALGTMSAGESATMTVVVRAAEAGDLTSTARVSSAAADENGGNDLAAATTKVSSFLAVSPARGTVGTEIEIAGDGFGGRRGKVQLTGEGGKKSLRVLSWNEADSGVIRALLRKTPPAGVYSLVVKRKDPKGAEDLVEAGAFEVVAPRITACPGSGARNAELTITGECFGTRKPKVYLEYAKGERTKRKSCRVQSWPDDSATGTGVGDLVVRLSRKVPPGGWKLVVKTRVGEDGASFTLTE